MLRNIKFAWYRIVFHCRILCSCQNVSRLFIVS
uniref:Uncharacterized protein n=1 Tax=Arundo donax TaxID=35708 RepID=A0A0A9F149_ARUDO